MDYAAAAAGHEVVEGFSDVGLPAVSALLLAVLVGMAFKAKDPKGASGGAALYAVAVIEAALLWFALTLARISAYGWQESFGLAFLLAFAVLAPGLILLLATRLGRSRIVQLGSFLASSRLGGTAAFLASFCFFTAVAIQAEYECWDVLMIAVDVFGDDGSFYASFLAAATAVACLVASLGAFAPVGFARSEEARTLSCVLSAACGVGAGSIATVVWQMARHAAYQHLGSGVWVYAAAVLVVVLAALGASLASWALSKRSEHADGPIA